MNCQFDEGYYRGKCCKRPVRPPERFCGEHRKEKCGVCGEQAVRWCAVSEGQFPCGYPLCEKHEHWSGGGKQHR